MSEQNRKQKVAQTNINRTESWVMLVTSLLDLFSLRLVLAREPLPLQISFIFQYQCSRKNHLWVFTIVFFVLGQPRRVSKVDFHCCLTRDLPYIASILFTDGKLQLKCTISEKTPAGSQAIVKKKIICCCCCCRCSRSYFAM